MDNDCSRLRRLTNLLKRCRIGIWFAEYVSSVSAPTFPTVLQSPQTGEHGTDVGAEFDQDDQERQDMCCFHMVNSLDAVL